MKNKIDLFSKGIKSILEECKKQGFSIPRNNYQGKAAIISIQEKVLEVEREIQELDNKKDAWETKELLTTREKEVLDLLGMGLSNKELAYRLSVSDRTVQFHIKSLFQKFNVGSRTEVVAFAI